jgi:hypothetical protein
MYRRTGNKWTVNECLRLTREFELLGLSIQEISELHERSPNAIMYKLDYEGIADYNDVFQNRQEKSCLSEAEESDAESKAEESEYADSDNDDAASENSEYIEAEDNDDAASENSEYEESEAEENEAEENEAAESDHNNEESISIYDVSQQIKNLTKQVSYLTKIVYNVFTDKNNPNAFRGHGLAGFH